MRVPLRIACRHCGHVNAQRERPSCPSDLQVQDLQAPVAAPEFALSSSLSRGSNTPATYALSLALVWLSEAPAFLRCIGGRTKGIVHFRSTRCENGWPWRPRVRLHLCSGLRRKLVAIAVKGFEHTSHLHCRSHLSGCPRHMQRLPAVSRR